MCTLIVGTRLWPEHPLVVAANRDEALDRAAEGPRLRTVQGVRIFAPRDLVAGGTWLGINQFGLFVGLTNRFGRAPDPARRSRGQLVLSMLTHRTAVEAAEHAGRLDPAQENGFHLVVADRSSAFVLRSDMQEAELRPLEPGWHVVTERSFGAADTQRPQLIARAIEAFPNTPPTNDALQAVLSLKYPDNAFDSVLVRVPTHNYGTRSATIVRFEGASGARMWHSGGPPDTTPFAEASTEPLWDPPGDGSPG